MNLDTYLNENVDFFNPIKSGEEMSELLENYLGGEVMKKLIRSQELVLRSSEYRKSFYDLLSSYEIQNIVYKNERDSIKKGLEYVEPRIKGSKSIHLGCGNGLKTTYLALKNPEVHFFAIDFVSSFLDSAKNQASKYEVNNITFIEADMKHLPFSDNYFDTVISLESLHELQTEVYLLNESFHILIPEVCRVCSDNVVGTLPVDSKFDSMGIAKYLSSFFDSLNFSWFDYEHLKCSSGDDLLAFNTCR